MKFKKSFLLLPLVLASVAAVASIDPVAELNEAITQVLKPLQNERTNATVQFGAMEILPQGVKKLVFDSALKKIGINSGRLANIRLSGNYANAFDGTDPQTNVKLSANFDLLSLIPQKDINELGNSIEELVKGLLESQGEYGDAITMVANVTEKVVDGDGNLQKIALLIDIKLDLSKLPADKPIDGEMLKELHIEGDISLNGISLALGFASNPAYKGFAEGQMGLKEWLEKLLARDSDTMKQVYEYAQTLSELSEYLVKEKDSLRLL